MANATASRLCSKCKDNIGSFNCEGCKEIFCTKHSIEHRQELCTKFEELMTELNVILQQTQDKEQQNQSLKKEFFRRIEEWENNMIEKVHEKGQQIRQRLGELIDNKNKMDIGNIQPMMDEIRKRYEKEDFFESDIERIKQNINQVQQDIEKSTEQSDVELYIEPKIKIDLTNLIYIEEKFIKASSSVTSKQSISKDSKGTENAMNLNPIKDSHPFAYPTSYIPAPFMPNSPRMYQSYVPLIRPPYEHGSIMNSVPSPYPRPPITTSTPYVQPAPTSFSEKRQRKPFAIIDPVSHKPIEMTTPSSVVDTNHIPSQVPPVNNTSSPSSFNSASTTDKEKTQHEFRHQMTKLLSTKSNT